MALHHCIEKAWCSMLCVETGACNGRQRGNSACTGAAREMLYTA